jgi:hypothetical protein
MGLARIETDDVARAKTRRAQAPRPALAIPIQGIAAADQFRQAEVREVTDDTKIRAVRPVAWLHSEDGRYDVLHDEVKALWLKARPKQVEHYTIPLYVQKQLNTEEACALIADTLGSSAMHDGNLLKLLRAVERAHGISQP